MIITFRKVDVRLPGKGNSNSHGARPVHLIMRMIKSIRAGRLSKKNSLSAAMQVSKKRFHIDDALDVHWIHGATGYSHNILFVHSHNFLFYRVFPQHFVFLFCLFYRVFPSYLFVVSHNISFHLFYFYSSVVLISLVNLSGYVRISKFSTTPSTFTGPTTLQGIPTIETSSLILSSLELSDTRV